MVMETVRKIEIFFITHSAQVLVFFLLLLSPSLSLFLYFPATLPSLHPKRLPLGFFFANVHFPLSLSFSSLSLSPIRVRKRERESDIATTTTQYNTNN
jgi:hypothetical protein